MIYGIIAIYKINAVPKIILEVNMLSRELSNFIAPQSNVFIDHIK